MCKHVSLQSQEKVHYIDEHKMNLWSGYFQKGRLSMGGGFGARHFLNIVLIGWLDSYNIA